MSGPQPPARYEIRVQGVLDQRWTAWFEGLQVTSEGSQTVICGPLPDQPALHGVLIKVRDLGMCLISVRGWTQTAPERRARHETPPGDRRHLRHVHVPTERLPQMRQIRPAGQQAAISAASRPARARHRARPSVRPPHQMLPRPPRQPGRCAQPALAPGSR